MTGAAPKLRIAQASDPAGQGWWKWAVWIDGDAAALKDVLQVEYVLHPTFPEPRQIVTDRKSKFRLEQSGWGEFEVVANVALKSGKTQRLRHWLKLERVAGREAPRRSRAPARSLRAAPPVAEATERTVFLSHGVAEASVANGLRKALEAVGVRAITLDELAPGQAWEPTLRSALRQAQAVVALLPPRSTASSLVVREARAALERGMPVVPVVLGSTSDLPDELRSLEALFLPGEEPPPAALGDVAAAVAHAL